MKNLLFILLTSSALVSCAQNTDNNKPQINKYQKLENLSTAYFASGCFWCVEAVYESVNGVQEAFSGYAGGAIKNPTYSQVSAGKTKHAEAVKVYYDPAIVNYETLVDIFFNSHDPTTLNQQGPDRGAQYRSIVFYQSESEKKIIERKISTLLKNKSFSKITTEVKPFTTFYKAEDYHQNYRRNHPNDSYVRNVTNPRLEEFRNKMPEVLKK